MSSQGPSLQNTDTVSSPPFAIGPTGGTPLRSAGYPFTAACIRDGSDWTAYKKQLTMVVGDTRPTQDPWIRYGNDYRIQRALGVYKGGVCTPCVGSPFS